MEPLMRNWILIINKILYIFRKISFYTKDVRKSIFKLWCELIFLRNNQILSLFYIPCLNCHKMCDWISLLIRHNNFRLAVTSATAPTPLSPPTRRLLSGSSPRSSVTGPQSRTHGSTSRFNAYLWQAGQLFICDLNITFKSCNNLTEATVILVLNFVFN